MRVAVRRLGAGCLVAAVGATAGVATAHAAVSPRVVSGGVVPITQHPWQVAIVKHPVVNAFQGQFCGGVIVDEFHVITAAHCLDLDGNGLPEDGDTRDVVAGMSDLGGSTAAPAQRIRIATWSGAPGFDFALPDIGPFDAALATLSGPLSLSGPEARPVALIDPNRLTPAGVATRVSGWGVTESLSGGSPLLRATELLTVSDPDCESFYPGDLDRPTMLCAIAPGKDSCNGDSGGPLTGLDGTLLGLVSWGSETCADASGAPGVYTEMANPDIASFIRDFQPTVGGLEYAPPTSSAPPLLAGLPKSGDTLTCLPGSWTSTAGAPEVDYAFRTPEGLPLRDWSTSTAFTPGDGDGGRRVVCVERARDATGAAMAASAPSEPVIGPPAPPAQAPAPVPQPAPAPAPATPRDTVSPRTSFVSVRCAKRRCVVRVRASDRGTPVSGVRDVRITVLPARGRTRTLTAKPLGRGVYQARFTRLSRGISWFTVIARDRAGNRPANAAIRRASVR